MRVRFAVDVSSVAPAGARVVVGDVFVPPTPVADDAAVLWCLPGGGMSRRYFDLRVPPEHGNFSMARHLAAHGWLVVTVDHLGVGESSRPYDGFTLTPRVVADVNAFVIDRVLARLRAGELAEGLGPVRSPVSIGVGHSAGASLTVHQQARHRTHVALALLGFSGRGLRSHLTEPELALADDPAALHRDAATLAAARFGSPLPMQRRGSSEFLVGAPMPEPVHEALVACRTNMLALVGLCSMVPGNAAPELASIDVPVFLAVGSRDIAGASHEIPAQLPSSPDVTLFVLDDAGHDHNVAPTREALWQRLSSWAGAVVADRR